MSQQTIAPTSKVGQAIAGNGSSIPAATAPTAYAGTAHNEGIGPTAHTDVSDSRSPDREPKAAAHRFGSPNNANPQDNKGTTPF
jgi:hypothetical protein